MDKRKAILLEQAFASGVSDAGFILVENIPIDPLFAGFCKEPGCPGYGASMSCPPNVMGPEKFKRHILDFTDMLVFKFDIPWEILLSPDRLDVNRIVHETAAGLEIFALENGFEKAYGLAGGCCKTLFCEEHAECAVLSGQGACRHPDRSRESMSGMGVDFRSLAAAVGWKIDTKSPPDREKSATGLMAGSVLLG